MANNYQSNPIVITGSMGSYKAAIALAKGSGGLGNTLTTLLVEKIYWENPITVGDSVSIGDPISGNVLLFLRCEVANQTQLIDCTKQPKIWQDFSIDSFVSGTLYIYTR